MKPGVPTRGTQKWRMTHAHGLSPPTLRPSRPLAFQIQQGRLELHRGGWAWRLVQCAGEPQGSPLHHPWPAGHGLELKRGTPGRRCREPAPQPPAAAGPARCPLAIAAGATPPGAFCCRLLRGAAVGPRPGEPAAYRWFPQCMHNRPAGVDRNS
jgi:hypothetical protein